MRRSELEDRRSEREDRRSEREDRRGTYPISISWLRVPSLVHSSTSRIPVASVNWLKLNLSLH